jgi:Protein of unknown function (DUF3800)
VRLIYFDEAGTASERQEPILIVAAVMIDADRDWLAIEEQTQQIVSEIIPEQDREHFRFHAKELFSSGTYNWGRTKRWQVLRAFLNIFDQYELPILWGGVDRVSMRQRLFQKHPSSYSHKQVITILQGIAFLICAAVAEAWFIKNAPREVGMCIGERALESTQSNIQALFREGRAKELVESFAPSKFRHLIDAVSFRSKNETIGVQLADACNFFIKRHEMGLEDVGGFYEILQPHILWRSIIVRGDTVKEE